MGWGWLAVPSSAANRFNQPRPAVTDRRYNERNDMSEAALPIEEFAKAMGVCPKQLSEKYAEMERGQIAVLEQALNAESNRRPFECRALPQGARVAARIPETLFFNLFFKKGFDLQGRMDAQDLSEVIEMFPQCRVETVADKLTVGYTGLGQRGGRHAGRRRIKFDVPGIKFAT